MLLKYKAFYFLVQIQGLPEKCNEKEFNLFYYKHQARFEVVLRDTFNQDFTVHKILNPLCYLNVHLDVD